MSRFVFAAVFVCASPAYAETAYFTAVRDLPVATGLSESANLLASFAAGEDSGLVIASAHGAATPESVRAFYTGWYTELVDALPLVENGSVTVDFARPGLGLDLLPDVLVRKDATVRRTGPTA